MFLKIFSWMIVFFALHFAEDLLALDQVRLLKISPGRDLIVLDVGKSYFSGLKPDLAALVDEQSITGKKFKEKKIMVLKALIKKIRLNDRYSVWKLVRLPGSFSYESGKKYFLLSKEKSLKGRKLYSFSGRKLVTAELRKTVKAYQQERDSALLAKKTKNYIVSDHVKTTQADYDKDFELPDISTWEGEEVLKEKTLYQSPNKDLFAKEKRFETFEKMVGLFLDIYNDPEFDYVAYYYNQRRNPSTPEFKAGSDQITSEESYWLKKKKAAENRERYLREITSKGESWSEDFNREELEEAVINIGLENERKRQTDFSLRRFDYQINFNVGFNLKDNASNTNSTGNNKFHLAAGLEFFPFKRFVELGKFSFLVDLRLAQDSIAESSAISAQIREFSMASFINYYFLSSAQGIGRVIPFVGAGVRFGFASVQTSDQLSGNYALSALPIFNLGFSYNMKGAQGYRVNLGIETLNLDYTKGDQGLSNKIIYEDARVGFAWTKLL